MPLRPWMKPAVGKVRAGHDLEEPLVVDLGVVDQRDDRVADLPEVVRRDVRRHADRDPGGAVDQQVRQPRRHHERLVLGAVVVRAEIHGLLVDVGEHRRGDLRHADLGVPHRRGRVAVDGAEVALPVDERVAQREVLRHAHDRVVDRGVAVRVEFADDLADRLRGLAVLLVRRVAGLVHRVEHAPVHRLEAVAHVGQRAPDDDAHRVVQVGLAHLVFDVDRDQLLRERAAAVRRVHGFTLSLMPAHPAVGCAACYRDGGGVARRGGLRRRSERARRRSAATGPRSLHGNAPATHRDS